MKVFKRQETSQFDQVKPGSLNDNTSNAINQYNGHLGAQTMPIDVVSNEKLVQPTASIVTSAISNKYLWAGQTQSYHSVRQWSGAEGGISSWLANTQINLANDQWTSGWNNLTNWPKYNDFYLEFDTQAGSLNGALIINFFHGVQCFSNGTTNEIYGEDWWTRFGLFMNGQLIADTGKCYPRGECLVIPFKVPVGTQSISLNVKWKTISTAVLVGAGTFTGDPSTFLEIFGAEVWACNTYK